MADINIRAVIRREAKRVFNDQYKADMEAIRHELETIWEAINELQGVDPERAGEPDADT